jgi:hypothetical protein
VVASDPALAPWAERASMRVLGSKRQALSSSRMIAAPAREVLQEVGRVLRGSPYGLILRETVGGHPLDGGVIVFDFSPETNNMTTGTFMWSRWGLFAKEVRCTLREVSANQTELSLHLDVRSGLKVNAVVYGALSGVAGVFGGAVIAGFLVKLGLAAMAGVAAGGVGAIAALGLGLTASGPLHRWEERTVEKELDRALGAVATVFEQVDVFGDRSPRAQPALPRGAARDDPFRTG